MSKKLLSWTYVQSDPRYGRLETPDGKSFFVGSRGRNGALDGDGVDAIIVRRADEENKSDEAKIVKITKRSLKPLYGTFRRTKGKPFWFVDLAVPENERVFVPASGTHETEDGEIVAVRVSGFWNHTSAEVLERIGRSGDIRTERELLVRESGIPVAFSEKALLEAERIEELPDGAKNRRDLSLLTVITIDGADAKDLDDAISLERLPDGNSELGVHIADVAEYVREGSELDREAIRRGTSCYLSDRVIPMLPEKLSNDLCSLHPGGKKFCLSIFLKIAKDGRVLDRRVEETVIHSAQRCTYDEVQSWQDADGTYPLPEPNVLELVRSLFDLVCGIDARREAEGRIDFEIPELKVVLDDQGEPERVAERDRKASHRLIETLMVLANEEISAHFSKITPFVFRVHEPPSPESQSELRELFATYGIRFKGMEIRPKDLQEAYLALKAKTGVPPIEKLLLSKLSKARYSELPLGHYGLSLAFYSHFTSPIRRYPDLQIHRIIKECLREKLSAERKKHYAAILPGGAKRASENERRAEGLERAVESFDAARYMERHVGETFSAIVVGKSKFAYYVKLENGIEGAVYLGKTSRGKTPDFPDFGTPIQVKLTSVERAYGRIDFEPVK